MKDNMMFGKKKETNTDKKDSKLSVLKHLKNSMSEMMGGDLKGKMVKATVAAGNPEDLKSGLEKAKELVSGMPKKEDASEEKSEHPEMSMGEAESEAKTENDLLDMMDSPEEIDEIIKQLQAKKQELMKG